MPVRNLSPHVMFEQLAMEHVPTNRFVGTTQQEFAAWAGASRAGVGHAFQTLRELGWIQTERRRILIRI